MKTPAPQAATVVAATTEVASAAWIAMMAMASRTGLQAHRYRRLAVVVAMVLALAMMVAAMVVMILLAALWQTVVVLQGETVLAQWRELLVVLVQVVMAVVAVRGVVPPRQPAFPAEEARRRATTRLNHSLGRLDRRGRVDRHGRLDRHGCSRMACRASLPDCSPI